MVAHRLHPTWVGRALLGVLPEAPHLWLAFRVETSPQGSFSLSRSE